MTEKIEMDEYIDHLQDDIAKAFPKMIKDIVAGYAENGAAYDGDMSTQDVVDVHCTTSNKKDVFNVDITDCQLSGHIYEPGYLKVSSQYFKDMVVDIPGFGIGGMNRDDNQLDISGIFDANSDTLTLDIHRSQMSPLPPLIFRLRNGGKKLVDQSMEAKGPAATIFDILPLFTKKATDSQLRYFVRRCNNFRNINERLFTVEDAINDPQQMISSDIDASTFIKVVNLGLQPVDDVSVYEDLEPEYDINDVIDND